MNFLKAFFLLVRLALEFVDYARQQSRFNRANED